MRMFERLFWLHAPEPLKRFWVIGVLDRWWSMRSRLWRMTHKDEEPKP